MEAKDLYPKLEYFIGGYFHQNWIDLVESRGEPKEYDYIVNDLLTGESRATLLKLSDDISRLLASSPSEEVLRRVIKKEFHGNIDPPLRGWTWRGWLEHVKKRIDEQLKFSLQ